MSPEVYAKVDRAAAVVAAIVAKGEAVYGINTGFGKLANMRIADSDLETLQRNLVLSHAAGVGERCLAGDRAADDGAEARQPWPRRSGVRRRDPEAAARHAARAMSIPVIPRQGSVGASGDLAPLAHLAAAMIGEGDAFYGGERMPAVDALGRAGLEPVVLAPKEGLALLNGTQVSTAHALHALFAIERVFQAALVTGALSTDAARGSDTPFDARIQNLRGHRGQIDVAAALRSADAGQRHPRLASHHRRSHPGSLLPALPAAGDGRRARRDAAGRRRRSPPKQTACPTIRWCLAETGEVISGGNFHAEPVAFAADMLALAICEIGSLAERRIAMLMDPALSGLPAFLTPQPGLNSGFMIAQVTAAALVSENKRMRHAGERRFDPDLRQSGGPCLDGGAWRAAAGRRWRTMPPMSSAIELLAAAQGCDFHAPLTSSRDLERARALLREHVPQLEADRKMAPDIATATEMVTTGALIEAAGPSTLPFARKLKVRSCPTRLDNDRIIRSPRGPVMSCKELADRSADAHADEQPRSGRGRETARARGLWRHRPCRARLGKL